jgi:hypothetical protein
MPGRSQSFLHAAHPLTTHSIPRSFAVRCYSLHRSSQFCPRRPALPMHWKYSARLPDHHQNSLVLGHNLRQAVGVWRWARKKRRQGAAPFGKGEFLLLWFGLLIQVKRKSCLPKLAVERSVKVRNHILPRLAAAPVALLPPSTQAHIRADEESTDMLLMPSAVRLPRSSHA